MLRHLLLPLVLLFFQNTSAQWVYPQSLQNRDVEVRYKVIYEKEPSEKLKKSPYYKTEYVVRFNQTILEEKVYPVSFLKGKYTLVDYDKQKYYQCYSKGSYKKATSYSFENYYSKLKPFQYKDSEVQMLGLPCTSQKIEFKNKMYNVVHTKALGIRYCRQFNVDGFLLEYPGYSKDLGHYKVLATTITYPDLSKNYFSLSDFYLSEGKSRKEREIAMSERKNKLKMEWIGEKMPKLNLVTVGGRKIKSKKLKDKVGVYYFMFTSYPPCKTNIPVLNNIQETFGKNKNVEILGFSFEDALKLKSYKKKYKSKLDYVADSRWLTQKLGITSYPTLFITDKKGIVKDIITGSRAFTEDNLKEAIKSYL